jgi:hypothetical protein
MFETREMAIAFIENWLQIARDISGLAKDTIQKRIPTWSPSVGIRGMDRRLAETVFTMLDDCDELGGAT